MPERKKLLDKILEAENPVEQRLQAYKDRIILDIPIEQIQVNEQVRKSFDKNNIEKLAEDIKENGLISPVLLNKLDKDKYELIVGENRYRAHILLGLKTIQARIQKDLTEQRKVIIQLAENMKRSDLTPLEIADGVGKLKQSGLKLREIANLLGKSEDHIKLLSRMNNLSKQDKAKIEGLSIKQVKTFLTRAIKKSGTVPLLGKKNEQLSLFSIKKSKIIIKAFTMDLEKESIAQLEEKIKQMEDVLKKVKNKLKCK